MTPPSTHGAAPGQLQHHVAAPGLAGEHRTLELERADQGEKVGDRRIEVVAGFRGIGATVAALIDRDHGVARRVKMLGHAVPQPGVGRQPVNEDEGDGVGISAPLLDVQRDARRDHNASLDGRRREGRGRLCHGRNRSILGRGGRRARGMRAPGALLSTRPATISQSRGARGRR